MKQTIVVLLTVAVILAAAVPIQAAGVSRYSDKDVRQLMNSIDQDIQRFGKAITPQYRKAVIRSANREVDVSLWLEDFKANASKMNDRFSSGYAAGDEVLAVLRTGNAIEVREETGKPLLGAEREWPRLQADLIKLAAHYGIDWKSNPDNWQSQRMSDEQVKGLLASITTASKALKSSLKTATKQAGNVSKDQSKASLDTATRIGQTASQLSKTLGKGTDPSGDYNLLTSTAANMGTFINDNDLAAAVGSSWTGIQSNLGKLRGAFEFES